MTTWVCVTRTVYRGVKVRLHTRASACLTECNLSACAWLSGLARWSILVAIWHSGFCHIASVCVCVCVSSRRFDWLAVIGTLWSHLSSFPVRMTGRHTELPGRHSLQPTAQLINAAKFLRSLSSPWSIIHLYQSDGDHWAVTSILFLCILSSSLSMFFFYVANIKLTCLDNDSRT